MTQEEFFKRYSYDLDQDYLGGGGFGKVFKAFDSVRDRWVAIKIAEVKPGMEQLSLQKEVELSAQLPEHTNIAHYEACHRFRTPHGVFDYGILQYYSAGNLSELIKTKSLSLSQKESIAKGILEGIGHLHSHNIIHRDLKSSNILIAERNDHTYIPKITDFGLSKLLSDTNQTHFTNSFAGGSLLYVAPEQLAGQTIRKNVDLWSYGVLLYELFTGRTPFYPEQSEINSESGRAEVVSMISLGKLPMEIEKIPEPWIGLVKKCLVPNPQTRVTGVLDIEKLIDQDSDNTTVAIQDKDKGVPIPTRSSKHRLLLYLSLGVFSLLLASGLIIIKWGQMPLWQFARSTNTIDSYKKYLKYFPFGIDAASARLRIDSLEFDRDIQNGKYTLNREFLMAIYAHLGLKEKGSFEEFESYLKVDRTLPRKLYDRYLETFINSGLSYIPFEEFRSDLYFDPNAPGSERSKWLEEFRRMKVNDENLSWKTAKSINSLDSYFSYLNNYPDGKHIIEAYSNIKNLRANIVDDPLSELEKSMVRIEGGNFQMGCVSNSSICQEDEYPINNVRVPAFYIGAFEVTQAQWKTIMGYNPPELYLKGCPKCPVENVSWNDVQEFLHTLNKITGKSYRLPSESEWEYAARGGSHSAGYRYAGSNFVDSVAWHSGNSESYSNSIGQKSPNELGLFDMSGNVWEWVEDCWNDTYTGAPVDGSAWRDGDCTMHVLRGGSRLMYYTACRNTIRGRNLNTTNNSGNGFRIASD